MIYTNAAGGPLAADTAGELVRSVVRTVADHGELRHSDNGLEVQELLAVNTVLNNPRARLLTSPSHPEIFNPALAVARFFYLISGSHTLDDIIFYSPFAARFSDDGLTMPGGSHGFRLFYPLASTNQIDGAVSSLLEHPERNRAAVAVFHPSDSGSPTVDLTCVMGAMFTCKQNRMQTLVNMRANDAVRLLWHDMFEFSMLGEFIASMCHFELGEYFHSAFVMMIIGRSALDAVDDVTAEEDVAPLMAAMPEVTSDTRPYLVRTERMIRATVAQQSFKDFRGLLDTLAVEPAYWADLFTSLAIQGRIVHSKTEDGRRELESLTLPAEFVVAGETLVNSLRLIRKRETISRR